MSKLAATLHSVEVERGIENLKKLLSSYKRVLIAYSGGVDSTLLLKVAIDTLGIENVLAVTCGSEAYPKERIKEAEKLAKYLGARHKTLIIALLNIPEFVENRRVRCYHCKKKVFTTLMEIAKTEGIEYVLDGTNADDIKETRPGIKALKELDIKSPLLEVGLTKEQIRSASYKFSLPTWDKPSFTCLASRFPYNTLITKELLQKVDEAERFILMNTKARQVRVRYHQGTARIEVEQESMEELLKHRFKIVKKLKELGFKYVTVDMEGYRTGSMDFS